MASLIVRKLDESLKDSLRVRAAKNGRSVEDEVRVILREAADGKPDSAPPQSSARPVSAQPSHRASAATTLPRVTLIIGGGIAAYKSLDLIRRLKERGLHVRCVMTRAAQQFVTPLSASALANERCYTDLFDAQSEFDAGHIRLARDTDLIVVAPATADLMAKMAQGHADDLATAILLATDTPVLIAPAMNPAMWANAATKRNVAQLARDGVKFIGPNAGEMAESGEAGTGRMAEPIEIADHALGLLHLAQPQAASVQSVTTKAGAKTLSGKTILITAGPTHEPIDPVRYIANRSSGKQGYALAVAAAAAGADVTLISGPVDLDAPDGVRLIKVESAQDMLAQVEKALPVDVAIFAAAVADWRVVNAGTQKIKKTQGGLPHLELTENPDILSTVSHLAKNRPALVIGFAAETENLIENATSKLQRKGCDWIVANDVSPSTGVMGGDRNTVHIISAGVIDSWPVMTKDQVADALVQRIAMAVGPAAGSKS